MVSIVAPIALRVLHLRFIFACTEPISLGGNPGSAIRGALYGAFAEQFCAARGGTPHWADERAGCPVCWLLALETPDALRGKDPPRPITIEPPVPGTQVGDVAADHLVFGVSLVGRAIELLPQLVDAMTSLESRGIGRRRGSLTLSAIDEYDPLSGSRRPIVVNGRSLAPKLILEQQDFLAASQTLPTGRLRLRFLTPTRLTRHAALVHQPDLAVLMTRLLERIESLERQAVQWLEARGTRFGDTDPRSGPNPLPQIANTWQSIRFELAAVASSAVKTADTTRWLDTWSGSSRTGRTTPTGGFVGTAEWSGEIEPLLPWLLWGQSLHVGKNAVKGDGWYQISR